MMILTVLGCLQDSGRFDTAELQKREAFPFFILSDLSDSPVFFRCLTPGASASHLAPFYSVHFVNLPIW